MALKPYLYSILLALTLILVGCQSENLQSKSKDTSWEVVEKRGKLIVATETGFAPFAFKTLVDGKDTIVGSDVDMIKAIADQLGVEVEFKEMSFDNVLATVQSGKADIGISGISITKERQKSFLFSTGYYTAKTTLMIQKSQEEKLVSIDDFADKSIASQKGSIQETLAKEVFSDAQQVSLPQTGEMVMELKQGKVEGILLEEPISKAYVAKNNDLMISSLDIPSDNSDQYGILLPKTSQALANKIDSVLKPMVTSGEVDQMIQDAFNLSVNQ
ncbi:transporter substrate-binding domain-containing protein [Streptococcus hyovaginalis]